jgi:hypothetical protein
MSLSVSAFAAYVITMVIAVAGAIVHPWFDAEAHFVKALTVLNADTAAAMTSPESP